MNQFFSDMKQLKNTDRNPVMKIWKEKPAGPEQIELERMFKFKEIDERATPGGVKQKNALFKDFSADVFAYHFRKTKGKMGKCATVGSTDGSSTIPEFSGYGAIGRCPTPPECFSQFVETSNETITQNNGPCWTWIYTDHNLKKDYVCVIVPGLCGKNAKFTISEDGMQIKIAYDWPHVMFKADRLFSKSKASDGQKLTSGHPKVHAFVSHLHETGVTEKSMLQAEITVELPRKIQRESDSWSMEKVVVDNSKMIILEFSAFQKALIINDVDTSLDF